MFFFFLLFLFHPNHLHPSEETVCPHIKYVQKLFFQSNLRLISIPSIITNSQPTNQMQIRTNQPLQTISSVSMQKNPAVSGRK